MARKRLSKLQKSEISRLLDERYVCLQLRLRRLSLYFEKNPSMYKEIVNELDLIDSISKIF